MILDQLQQLWNGLIDLTSYVVIPDWGSLVGLLPIFLVVGVVGPILTLLAIAWFIYFVRKPRLKVAYRDPRRPAPLGANGQPEFPVGEPYSVSEAMVYETGATRSASGDPLVVACPKCSLVRPAVEDTCGNCGLSFTLRAPTLTVRPVGPPPGGRAAV